MMEKGRYVRQRGMIQHVRLRKLMLTITHWRVMHDGDYPYWWDLCLQPDATFVNSSRKRPLCYVDEAAHQIHGSS